MSKNLNAYEVLGMIVLGYEIIYLRWLLNEMLIAYATINVTVMQRMPYLSEISISSCCAYQVS